MLPPSGASKELVKRNASNSEDAEEDKKLQKPNLKVVSLNSDEHISIAVVDDDEATLIYLADFFAQKGYDVETFADSEAFLGKVSNAHPDAPAAHLTNPFPYDLVFSDVKMPKVDGLQLISRIHLLYPDVPVVLMTAYSDVQDAVAGMKEGAYDYVEKPFTLDRIDSIIRNALWLKRLQQENRSIRGEGMGKLKVQGVLCESPAMKAIYDLLLRVAPTDSSVLITGESGVGKEVVARAIHDNSRRENKPFVSVNCSAIPESLLESELFGHTKGSFTGATQERRGLFEEANGGTLFLDEIGDLDTSLQAKILRAVQERKIRAVGDNKYRQIDVRIISATHRNLVNEIKQQNFREDLYYRLNVIPIHIPPLRQRREDIPILAKYFLDKFSLSCRKEFKGFRLSALNKLIHMQFKGNVRELQNVVERSVVLSQGEYIDEYDIPVTTDKSQDDMMDELTYDFPSLREVESRYITSVLDRYKGRKEVVAKVLGLSRRTLYRRLIEMGQGKDAGGGGNA
ncbi:MAG: sigma-54-dependent transcriptional regulator [Bacteriovoracia bacterium]